MVVGVGIGVELGGSMVVTRLVTPIGSVLVDVLVSEFFSGPAAAASVVVNGFCAAPLLPLIKFESMSCSVVVVVVAAIVTVLGVVVVVICGGLV